jgi:hypothetical protein
MSANVAPACPIFEAGAVNFARCGMWDGFPHVASRLWGRPTTHFVAVYNYDFNDR